MFVTTLEDVVTVLAGIDRTMAGETLNVFAPSPSRWGTFCDSRARLSVDAAILISLPAGIALPLLKLAAPAHSGLRRHRENLAALEASQMYGYSSGYTRLGLMARPVEAMVRKALEP